MTDTNSSVPTAAAGADVGMSEDFIREIRGIFSDKLHLRLDSVDADLFETGILDSMSLVHLIMELEKHLGVDLPMQDLDLELFRSASSIARYMSRRVRAAKQEKARGVPCESC